MDFSSERGGIFANRHYFGVDPNAPNAHLSDPLKALPEILYGVPDFSAMWIFFFFFAGWWVRVYAPEHYSFCVTDTFFFFKNLVTF